MRLIRKSRDDNDGKEELKSQIVELMRQYDEEEIDGESYFQKMMNLSSSYQKKNKKWESSVPLFMPNKYETLQTLEMPLMQYMNIKVV